MYDEGVGPFVLNADNLAKLSKPRLQVLLGRVLAITLHIDLGIAGS